MTDSIDLSFNPDDELPRISTGSEGLDDILGGGLDANRMYLYEGSPGAGKTTIVKGIIRILEQKGRRILLCAPTGRAAKIMAASPHHRQNRA